MQGSYNIHSFDSAFRAVAAEPHQSAGSGRSPAHVRTLLHRLHRDRQTTGEYYHRLRVLSALLQIY